MDIVDEALQDLRGKLEGEPLQIAERTLQSQFRILGRKLQGEDTSADESHVLSIARNLDHVARRALEEVWIAAAGRAARALLIATVGA